MITSILYSSNNTPATDILYRLFADVPIFYPPPISASYRQTLIPRISHYRCTPAPPPGLALIHSRHNTGYNPKNGSIIISIPHHTSPIGRDSPPSCRHCRYSNKASPPGQNRGCLRPVTGSRVREILSHIHAHLLYIHHERHQHREPPL